MGRGSFSVELKVDAKDEAEAVLPGMTCKLRLAAYEKKKALLVPRQALFEDEEKPGTYHIYVETKDGAPEKREVRVGKRSGDRAEILKGVKAGDSVLLQKPKGES
jgi:multidrug efflux pump subunit AcrA (membrane-fusion protein)